MKTRIKNTILVNGKRKICRIFDNGGETCDRFTVAFKAERIGGTLCYPYIAASENPFHPQGVGQHGEARGFLKGNHLGKRVRFDDVPSDVKKFILQNIS